MQRTISQNIQPTRTGSHPVHNQPFSCPTSSSRILIQDQWRKEIQWSATSHCWNPIGRWLSRSNPSHVQTNFFPLSLQLDAKSNSSQVLIKIGHFLEQNRPHFTVQFSSVWQLPISSVYRFPHHCNQAQPTSISCKRSTENPGRQHSMQSLITN